MAAAQRKYLEQLERIRRYYQRFKEVNEGTSHTRNSFYYEDDVYAFFINSHHMRDWILNDPGLTVNKDSFRTIINNFINKSDELKISGDLCNGAKHLKCDNLWSGKERTVGPKAYSVTITEGSPQPPIIKIKFFVDGRDAFEIATICLKKWEEFIATHSF
jgi:hypothetical protein